MSLPRPLATPKVQLNPGLNSDDTAGLKLQRARYVDAGIIKPRAGEWYPLLPASSVLALRAQLIAKGLLFVAPTTVVSSTLQGRPYCYEERPASVALDYYECEQA